jgi:hypothetical protein
MSWVRTGSPIADIDSGLQSQARYAWGTCHYTRARPPCPRVSECIEIGHCLGRFLRRRRDTLVLRCRRTGVASAICPGWGRWGRLTAWRTGLVSTSSIWLVPGRRRAQESVLARDKRAPDGPVAKRLGRCRKSQPVVGRKPPWFGSCPGGWSFCSHGPGRTVCLDDVRPPGCGQP